MRFDKMLEGKKALVTAGANGLGLESALLFASQGADVAIIDIDAEAGKKALAKLCEINPNCKFYKADMTSAAEVKAACAAYLADFGCADVLLNCTGGFKGAYIDELDDEDIEAMFAINLKPAVYAMREIIPTMTARGTGSVINLTSCYVLQGVPGVSVYAAAKGALHSLTTSVAMDCASSGVRVNSIAPGMNFTSMGDKLIDEIGEGEALNTWLRTQLIMRRGAAEEIAEAALYLASDMSRFVTAQNLIVDGGQTVIAHKQTWRPGALR